MKNKTIWIVSLGPIAAIALTFLIMEVNQYQKPASLEDAWTKLESNLDSDGLNQIQNGDEKVIVSMLSTYGIFIKKKWIKNGQKELIEYFHSIGITDEDTMTLLILDTFQRHLQKKPIIVQERAEYYKTKRIGQK